MADDERVIDDEILTADEAAELLRMTRRALVRKAQAGLVPGWQTTNGPKGRWRFSRLRLLEMCRGVEERPA